MTQNSKKQLNEECHFDMRKRGTSFFSQLLTSNNSQLCTYTKYELTVNSCLFICAVHTNSCEERKDLKSIIQTHKSNRTSFQLNKSELN